MRLATASRAVLLCCHCSPRQRGGDLSREAHVTVLRLQSAALCTRGVQQSGVGAVPGGKSTARSTSASFRATYLHSQPRIYVLSVTRSPFSRSCMWCQGAVATLLPTFLLVSNRYSLTEYSGSEICSYAVNVAVRAQGWRDRCSRPLTQQFVQPPRGQGTRLCRITVHDWCIVTGPCDWNTCHGHCRPLSQAHPLTVRLKGEGWGMHLR